MSSRSIKQSAIAVLILLLFPTGLVAETVLGDSTFGLLMYSGYTTEGDTCVKWFWEDLAGNLKINVILDNPMDSTQVNCATAYGVRCIQSFSSPVNGRRSGAIPTTGYAGYYRYFDCAQKNAEWFDIFHNDSCYGEVHSIEGNNIWKVGRFTSPDSQLVNMGPNSLLHSGQNYTVLFKIAIDEIRRDNTVFGHISIGYRGKGKFNPLSKILLKDDGDAFSAANDFVWVGDSSFAFTSPHNAGFEYRIYSYGLREIYVDSAFAASETCINLLNGKYDDRIITQVLEWANNDTVFGYYTFDEPYRDEFASIAYINDLVQDTLRNLSEPDSTKHMFTAYFRSTKLYFENIDANFLEFDMYPLGGYGPENMDYYYGDSTVNRGHPVPLQHALSRWWNGPERWYIVGGYKPKIRYAIDTAGVDDVYFTLQAYNHYKANTGLYRRRPTPSELRCFAGMVLCERIDGLSFFLYEVDLDASRADSLLGLVWADGTPRADPNLPDTTLTLHGALKNHVIPFVKGIEPTYLGLHYARSYEHNPNIGTLNTFWLDSISYYTDESDTANPDAGWFHFGEFTDDSGYKYIMIVNRACNDTLGGKAPAVWATPYLNPEVFNRSNRYKISAVDTNSEETIFIRNDNSLLYFTTILGAGEAKLFKFEPVR
ncbi:MAG: hypothetical protein GF307_08045 [candidate division Zixibacteria bacterium]|nr:hypothetical protein [candidate division Zixibacteria bacterium]